MNPFTAPDTHGDTLSDLVSGHCLEVTSQSSINSLCKEAYQGNKNAGVKIINSLADAITTGREKNVIKMFGRGLAIQMQSRLKSRCLRYILTCLLGDCRSTQVFVGAEAGIM